MANRGMFIFTVILAVLVAASQIIGAPGLGFLTSGVFGSKKSATDSKENTFKVSTIGYKFMKLTNLTQIISFALILLATVMGLTVDTAAIRRSM